MTGVAGVEALVILILCALIYGQPASAQADRAQIVGQSTEVARWKGTVMAYPTATNRPCRPIGSYIPNC